MAAWSGFSDEDLRRMKRESSQEDEGTIRANARKQALARRGKPQQGKQRPVRQNSNPYSQNTSRGSSSDGSPSINPAMALSAPSEKEKSPPEPDTSKLHCQEQVMDMSPHKETVNNAYTNDSKGQEDLHPTPVVAELKELNETEALKVELGNVQKFQQQQKVIEEANKHKRALLSKAIDDRRKQAKAEADKLMKVQQELNHLDTLLTADVSIIRDKIEIASLEYNDAQKRYVKAENEFVAAKLSLFEKSETKEHLTEHLYTIIHQNEVRKAKKLVELMEKLTMDVTPEEMELSIPAIPQLTNFNAVATLHDPHRKRSQSTSDKEEHEHSVVGKKLNDKDKDSSSQGKGTADEESGILVKDGGAESVEKLPLEDVSANTEGKISDPHDSNLICNVLHNGSGEEQLPSQDSAATVVSHCYENSLRFQEPGMISESQNTSNPPDDTQQSIPHHDSLVRIPGSVTGSPSERTNRSDSNGTVQSTVTPDIPLPSPAPSEQSSAQPSMPSLPADSGRGWKLPFT